MLAIIALLAQLALARRYFVDMRADDLARRVEHDARVREIVEAGADRQAGIVREFQGEGVVVLR